MLETQVCATHGDNGSCTHNGNNTMKEEIQSMSDDQVLARINSFSRWHYQFELAGHKTPILNADNINRHQQRKNHFFRPLVNLFGGSLVGKRVLDLGCNAGFWSLAAIESGCDYVLGIDGRQMHIDQAEFIFEVKGIEHSRYSFHCGNVLDLLNENLGRFDIVLCLGLMYHISKPITLLEQISALNNDLLVIDTSLSKMEGSILEVRHESLDDPRNAIDHELILVPTKVAVLDMVHQFGYHAVTLRPNFADYAGAHDYKDGYRRAFICSKRTDLSALCSDIELPQDIDTIDTGPSDIQITKIPAKNLVHALTAKVMGRLGQTSAARRGQ
jgi:tRNA (mo5U34)-methyltransferase